jgi:arsenite methyltransferase
MSDTRERVRKRYGEAARAAAEGRVCGCGPDECCGDVGGSGSDFYLGQDSEVPRSALLASLGCGNPTVAAELRPGEVVLDLGSGGGIDVLLSARRVGPHGTAYGLDMTDEMLDLARRNAVEAGLTNVEFIKGYIEDVPLPAASVDVIVSNCVINLSPEKPRVFEEMARILRPGGRIGISDIVADDALDAEERGVRGSWVGCIAGALSFGEYRAELDRTGFVDIDIRATHEVADGVHGAIIRAKKPLSGRPSPASFPAEATDRLGS